MEGKKTAEEQFRDGLLDVAAVVEKLLPFCEQSKELLEVVQLALTNDAQLKILLKALEPSRRQS